MAQRLNVQPLKEVTLSELSYERYFELASSLEPFAVVDAASLWPAAKSWANLQHIAEHPAVDADAEEAELQMHPSPMDLRSESADLSLSDALGMLTATSADPCPQNPLYLKWAFGHIPELVNEMPVHKFCASGTEPTPAENPLLLRPGRFFCWLYAGQPGSGSASHTDVLNSAAWLTLLRGRKEWILAPGGDLDKLTAADGSRRRGSRT
eukprot:TRINITY_DN11147_c0_g1_i2.p3 TRINITY_DN11147_c0_g1~~TRINITY_DN11147_c0_g1_i2.p3  ORF type:complete len:209 (+),score=35.60 TRINITY_DN11147_c0_g1_i2:59-685(+)